MVFIGTALLTALAAGAKSMKEAQSHMTLADAAADAADRSC